MKYLNSVPRIVVSLVVLSVGAYSNANLLTNGSFESHTYTFGGDGGVDLGPGNTGITGWSVVTNDVAPISSANTFGIAPEDGAVSLDLQSYNDSSPYGGVSQSISTVLGATYDLSFYIGVQNDVGYSVGPASVMATAGATSGTFTNTATASGNQWQLFSMSFVATATSTPITLQGTFTGGGAYIGLDNVDVEVHPTPEPASFVGCAVSLAFLRRRRARQG